MMKHRRALIGLTTVFAGFGLSTSIASAQHAGYTLFGDPERGSQVSVGPSENQFVHPVTSVVYHEDSFVTTDIRVVYSYNSVDRDSRFLDGEMHSYLVQGRVALTDQFQLLIYRAGYLDIQTDAHDDSGAMDTALGLKWKFLSDWNNQLHMAVGVGYEFPVGSPKVLANDDELRLWYSVNKGFGRLHLGATVNYTHAFAAHLAPPLGSSDQISWHVHADYYLTKQFSPIVELNGYHRIGSLNNFGDMGGDMFNFAGSSRMYTAGAGVEYRPLENWKLRAAVEVPIDSEQEAIYDWRVNVGFVLSF